jgi:hypothetical protein
MRELRRVFRAGSPRLMHVQIARLCVLYEDLRIELFALREESLPILDVTDARYRVNYFLRRAIATLVEFAEAVRLLSELDDFKRFCGSVDGSLSAYWTNGSAYFKSNERFLENIRNDIGGHFGSKAAIYALENLSADAVGHMEFRGTGKEQTMHLHFAGELVATAMLRHLHGDGVEDRFHQITQVALEGFRHATLCTQFVAIGDLWDRFG